MKNKIIPFLIISLCFIQITAFIFLNNYKIQQKPTVIKVNKEYSLNLEEVVQILEKTNKLNIKNIKKKESGYEVSVEIICEKQHLEKILKDINYFGVISYTITIEENNIFLYLTMKERLNNNCI